MAEQIQDATPEPELTKKAVDPKGVLQKNLKPMLYLGAAMLVIVAAIFSRTGNKTATRKGAAPNQPAQPMLDDNTENNVRDLKSQVLDTQQKAAQRANSDGGLATTTSAQQAAPADFGPTGQASPCVPGQPCTQQQGNDAQRQLSPAQQEEQQLAAKDRELAYNSRFASNLVFAHASEQLATQQGAPGALSSTATGETAGAGISSGDSAPALSRVIVPRAAGDPTATAIPQTAAARRPEVNIDAALGQPYVIYEGTALDTVLMNRLDGDAVGPVKVLVSNPVYSHDRQHVLVPEGAIVLGEAKKIGSTGFGQQRRIAVVFHRMIMPDGYSVDLDQFHGLDETGEEGLKDKVNNHYLEIFGTSIALGVLSGAGEIEEGGGTISTSGSQAFATGASASVSQSATTIVDRFMQIPPTITIREGHRVKVYFTQDMLLPAYETHTIPQTY